MLPKLNKDLKFPINYLPISLISSTAKIYENILLTKIECHAFDNNIIPDFQHGFLKNTSICHQLLRTANKTIYGFKRGKTTGGLFLDVEKAFDRLWHNGLVFKMINLNYPPYLIHTITGYLKDRIFQVRIQATESKIGQIQTGSTKGSILNPILYNSYTQDYPTSPLVDICLFADDAAILSQSNTPHEVRKALQKCLIKLKRWSKLSLNNKRKIYLQYLRPFITYASPIWEIAAECRIDRLQVLQKPSVVTHVKRSRLHETHSPAQILKDPSNHLVAM
ncbi:RNA-directed DNA polymerase from mobile element jockey [Trichonephila clavipes]|nr:RNA-directed DNA polymerase from mobile element jockey [Trichonephila clavipes]